MHNTAGGSTDELLFTKGSNAKTSAQIISEAKASINHKEISTSVVSIPSCFEWYLGKTNDNADVNQAATQ